MNTFKLLLLTVSPLKDAIHALEQQWAMHEPDSVFISRQKWDEPGYRTLRALQFQLSNRTWLVPLYKEILETWKKREDQGGLYKEFRSVL